MDAPPRYAPARPLPPYAWIPGGGLPHPRRHPDGHSYGHSEAGAAPLDPAHPQANPDYLAAIDLYNAGFYWEAHEVLEALWHAAGRTGPVAELLLGLIKLAAAGVKLRQQRPAGVRKHAVRAARHFARLAEATGAGSFAGLDLRALEQAAHDLDRDAGNDSTQMPLWRLDQGAAATVNR